MAGRCKFSNISLVLILLLTSSLALRFECPSRHGSFANAGRCDQYFTCLYGQSILRRCPSRQLFDVDNGRCAEFRQVQCGVRPVPSFTLHAVEQEPLISSMTTDECMDYRRRTPAITTTIYTGTTTDIVRITEDVTQTWTKNVHVTTTVWI